MFDFPLVSINCIPQILQEKHRKCDVLLFLVVIEYLMIVLIH